MLAAREETLSESSCLGPFFFHPVKMTKFKMEVVAAVAAWALTSACTGLPAVRHLVPGLCPRDIDEAQALQSSLSPGAKVYFPGSPEFDDASTRWSTLSPPTVNVVVVAATAKDVSETVSEHTARPTTRGALANRGVRSNMQTGRSCRSWRTIALMGPSPRWAG